MTPEIIFDTFHPVKNQQAEIKTTIQDEPHRQKQPKKYLPPNESVLHQITVKNKDRILWNCGIPEVTSCF